MKITEVEAKSIIVPSKLLDQDYVINPYTGCQFECLYCYATFMGRYVNESRNDWGNYVYVKLNAVEVVRKQLGKWGKERRQSSILLSSVTDPYQGVERKYKIVRGILEVFIEAEYPGQINLLTKSPLIERDLDLLKQLNMDVGLTITTTDDKLSRFLEVKAPSASRRLDTLAKLVQEGIRTYAFIGPLLPHFRYQPELLDDLFKSIAETGTQDIYIEHINLPGYIKQQMSKVLNGTSEEIRAIYEEAKTQTHRDALDIMVNDLLRKYNLKVRLGGTIYHPDMKLSG